MINLARETTASNDQALGIDGGSTGTATEAQILDKNSGTRFQSVVDLNGYEFFGGLANLMYWFIKKMAQDGDYMVRESSQDGEARMVTRADLVNDYNFVPVTSAVINGQRNQMQTRLGILQQVSEFEASNPNGMLDADGNQYTFDKVEFYLKEILPLAGVKNGRTYFKVKTPEQMMQEQQAKMAEQSAQMALKTAGKPAPGSTGAPGVPQAPQGPPVEQTIDAAVAA
jgi:hypothetical protein